MKTGLPIVMGTDLRKYETKEFGPFTKYQAIYIGIGLVIAIPLIILLPGDIINRVLLGILVTAPFFVGGFIKISGCRFEQLIIRIIYKNILTPKIRKAAPKNSILVAYRQMEEQEEQERIRSLSKDKRKAYLKAKKNRTITYSNRPERKIYR